jgi:hypothetical protein
MTKFKEPTWQPVGDAELEIHRRLCDERRAVIAIQEDEAKVEDCAGLLIRQDVDCAVEHSEYVHPSSGGAWYCSHCKRTVR